MPAKDYYKILGVSKDASADEIKSAYRKLAKQYHPDLHPNDAAAAEKFKECNEAYSIIGDPDKRRKYDNGELDDNGDFNPFGGGGFSASGFDDIFDIFSGFMGGGSSSRRTSTRQAVGSDITYNLDLSFMEAALGTKRSISFSRVEKCSVCHGTGAKDERSVKTCDKCNGTGQVRYTQSTLFGQQVSIGACDRCGGSGKIVTDNCKSCGGKGIVSKNKVMNVTIPAGVENGSVLQIPNEGNAPKAANGKNGNLLLVLNVRPSKVFRRENLNLYVEAPVSYTTAVLGGEIQIPALDGTFITKIPEGTANGEVLKFRNRGIKTSRGNCGDLFVTVKVEVPQNLSRSQKKLIEDTEKEFSIKNYPKTKEYLEEIAKLYNK
ncbi:MAG: molecular chaperone DnaJ [Corallococcus sp.]|nr:molecular chaperone DnaJ [Corallococcus sp.]